MPVATRFECVRDGLRKLPMPALQNAHVGLSRNWLWMEAHTLMNPSLIEDKLILWSNRKVTLSRQARPSSSEYEGLGSATRLCAVRLRKKTLNCLFEIEKHPLSPR